jgi:F-type H+-transporting ATPase subunit epsilon
MAALHFEFVSPERVLFSGDVDQVDLPGSEGDMGILPQHAPLVTTLRPGIVTMFNQGRREEIVVVGGFAEVSPAGLTILADRAEPREAFDMTMLATAIRDAEEDVADAKDDAQRDKLRRHLEQLKSLQAALGATLGPSSGSQRPDGPRRPDAPH